MSEGQKELFAFLAAAFTTLIGLFVAQELYASWADVQFYESRANAPANAKVAAKRASEAQALAAGGRMAIGDAMKALAERGRGASPAIAPQQSEDVSAMSGWIHRRDFAPYVPAAPPPEPEPAALPTPVPDSAPAEQVPSEAAAAQPGEGAPSLMAKPAQPVVAPEPTTPAPRAVAPATSAVPPPAGVTPPPHGAPPGLKVVPQPRREAPEAGE